MVIYGKKYDNTTEMERRKKIFIANILFYSAQMESTKYKPVRRYAQYSDLTRAELQTRVGSYLLERSIQ